MKKRMLGLLLALCMVLALMPVSALADDAGIAEQASQTGGIAAYAAGEHTDHCICGKEHENIGDHTASKTVTYTAWESNDSLPKDGGNYYLTQDVKLESGNSGSLITQDTIICLNGHSITTSYAFNCITVKGAKLILTDCNKNPGYISTTTATTAVHSGLYLASDDNYTTPGIAELYNISVKNCSSHGIYLGSSALRNPNTPPNVLRMYNANVTGNKDSGIYRYTYDDYKTDVYIYGGSLSYNGNNGIRLSKYDTLNMTGTTVKRNENQGIAFYDTQKDAVIKDCDISDNYGGIHAAMDANATLIIGGNTKIRDNTRGNYGGIYLSSGNLVLQGDTEITGNKSSSSSNGQGGGIYYNTSDNKPTLTIKDNVKITGNKDSNKKDSNIAVYGTPSDSVLTIPSDNTFRGKVGFHLESDFPTVDNPVNIAQGDYLPNFTHEGDTTKYLLVYDQTSDHVQLQAAPYAQEPTVRSGMTYTGETQTGVFAGAGWTVVSGNTEATDAGDYTVTIKPRTGLTWSDSTTTAKTYNWSIRMADPARKFFTITHPASSTPYDGTVKSVDVSLKSPYTGCGDITVEYKYSTTDLGSQEVVSASDVKNVGYYSYAIDIAGGTNFNSGKLEGGIFWITKADQSALNITSKNTLPYGQSMTLTAEGGSTHNAIVWQLVDESGNTIESSEFASLENGVLTALKSCTVHVKATMPGDGNNYNDVSATMTITITKGWVTIKADDKTAYIGDTDLPTNTHTVSGLAVGDVLSGQDVYTYYVMEGDVKTKVAPGDIDLTKAGEYIIEVSGLAADTTKYDSEITYVPGKLTVTSKPNNNTGSGSGSSDSGYKVTLPSSTNNGSVKSNVTTAEKGDTVTITAIPATGYVIDKLTVTDKNGSELELTDKGNGRYSFTMPGSKVTVDVTFKAEAQQNPEKTGFDDVSDSDWYSEAVDYAYEKGLMSGVGNNLFAPKADTTRGMLMTVLARYAGQDTTGGSIWYEKGMNWAKANGVSDGTNPTASITREQLVTMLWRYAGEADSTVSLDGFNDASTVSGYAVTAMRWAVENGIINGANGSLNPKDNASRAEVAAILMRFCEMGK